jgi:excisionase family DNA binding protein
MAGAVDVLSKPVGRRAMSDWITTTEAIRLTGYNAEYIRRLVRSKKIVARKFGTLWQIDRKSLLSYLKTGRQSEDKRHGPRSR